MKDIYFKRSYPLTMTSQFFNQEKIITDISQEYSPPSSTKKASLIIVLNSPNNFKGREFDRNLEKASLGGQKHLLIMNLINQNTFSEESLDESSQYTENHAKISGFRRKNRLHWSVEENIKYCHFLYQNKVIFKSEQLRKQKRIFSQLSLYLKSRKTSCVKSHHQKMIKRHKEVENIIRFMEKKYKTIIFPQQLEDCYRIKKEVELQTDKQSFHEISQEKQSQKQDNESQQIFIKATLEHEEIKYEGFDMSEWGW